MNQQQILFQKYLDPIKIKEGTEICPVCGNLCRANAKYLDKRLVDELREIAVFIREKGRKKMFAPREVFGEDHQKNADFQKLGCWSLIKRTKKGSWWEMTDLGWRFLDGKISLPKMKWIYNNKTLIGKDGKPMISDTRIKVNNVDERWQLERADYSLDYLVVPIKKELKPEEVDWEKLGYPTADQLLT